MIRVVPLSALQWYHLHRYDGTASALSALIVCALLALCVITCPKRDAHSDAIMKLVNVALDSELSKNLGDDELGLAIFGSVLGSGIAEIVVDKKMVVDNYFVCSIGRIPFDGKDNIVSVGVLNHVFTLSEEDLKQKLKELKW